MPLFKGSIIAVLLLCLGCSAQSPTTDQVNQRIEKQVRIIYQDRLPSDVQIAVTGRKPSEIPNYDTVTVTFSQGANKQTQDFLVSKDGKTMARFSKWDLTKDPYAEVMAKIDTTGRPYKGNKDAKVVVVNYDDFQCPFCSRMHQTMNVLMQSYGDRVKLVYKDFPLSEIHPWATHAAVNANCIAAQNQSAYWAFADYLHAHGSEIGGSKHDIMEARTNLDKAAQDNAKQFNLDGTKLDACIAKNDTTAIDTSSMEAVKLGIEATPTMFINGERLSGALPARELEAVLNRALRDAGVQPPTKTQATETSEDDAVPAAQSSKQ